jgi:Peptidase inhibitor I78 family
MNIRSFKAGGSLALFLPLLLSACAVSQSPVGQTARPIESAPTCQAQPASAAVGQTATARVVEQARQQSGSRLARVLRPGQAVTMEFMGDRLNLDVNAAGVVTRVRCG